jgi:hypothetical protein
MKSHWSDRRTGRSTLLAKDVFLVPRRGFVHDLVPPTKTPAFPRTGSAGAPCRRLLFLEPLEDRLAPAVFTVTNTGDTGSGAGLAGDLRYCITQANATPGTDTIQFAIAGTGLQTISLTSALPAITDSVVIDGYTQAGASPNSLATGDNAVLAIELNGSAAGTGVNGLTINAGVCTISGLVIDGFGADGIFISGASASGNIIEGNFIGTDATGATALGNGGDGVAISNALNNTIGGTTADARNLISGNTGNGITITAGTNAVGNVVEGNFIGTDATGTVKLGNASIGVYIGAANNAVGGTADGARNIISGNLNGVRIDGVGNQVLGNFIGTDVTGAYALGNKFEGVIFLNGNNNTVGGATAAARNVISGNGEVGLWISINCNSDVVQGNYIGTDATGTIALPNAFEGLRVIGDANNTIGGAMAGAGNVISGNGLSGVLISDSGATGNLVAGNYMGTDASGIVAIANGSMGVLIQNGASNNTIGGITAGAGNVISGNAGTTEYTGSGIVLRDAGTSANVVLGNLIGTDATGAMAVPNAYDGVLMFNEANNSTIGGTVSGARNLISGNNGLGVHMITAPFNVVQGNYVGTNSAGSAALPNLETGVGVSGGGSNNTIGGAGLGAGNLISGNGGDGIFLYNFAADKVVQGNTIGLNAAGNAAIANSVRGVFIGFGANNNLVGGTAPGAGNVISGNTQVGVGLNGSAGALVSGNTIAGNLIGTDAAGTASIGNTSNGVEIDDFSPNNTVGGTETAARNIISGNTQNGIFVTGGSSTGNLVEGNYVGTNAAGTTALANQGQGILVASSANSIGGTATGAGNLISGNTGNGIWIDGSNNNVVQGNLIGTDATGMVALPNGDGIELENAANNLIGGTDLGARNVISGSSNTDNELANGIYLILSGTTGNVIQGNYIGTNATGLAALGNQHSGVYILNGPTGNTVGGTTTATRNVISGNTAGVSIASADGNTVEGNFIGPDVSGTASLGGQGVGIEVWNGAADNVIGGTAAGAGNVISGNSSAGVHFFTTGSGGANNDIVQGNLIGTTADGTTALANGTGVLVQGGSSNNTIGGTAVGARNVISGNSNAGVEIAGSSATGNVVEGNYIGTDVTGTAAVGNHSAGVLLRNATGNTIGGLAPGARNLISGNLGTGVPDTGEGVLMDQGSSGNVVQGNYIGTDVTGTLALANVNDGVKLIDNSTNNTIGGTVAGARNLISGNGNSGLVIGIGASNNLVQGNYIGTDFTGTAALGNSHGGLELVNFSTGNTIGGSGPGAGNVISANAGDGLVLGGFGVGPATGNVVAGNFIGTNAAGIAALSNGGDGIVLDGTATGNSIGLPGAGNVISGNQGSGILLDGAGVSGNGVAGNFLGNNVSGTAPLPNGAHGVLIDGGATNNTVGGTTAAARNIISGNAANGVTITYSTANVVEGNYIGTDSSGTVALANGFQGVAIFNYAADNTIGGSVAGAGNLISGNSNAGVAITGLGADGNHISGNLIGTNATGTAALPNGYAGVQVDGGSMGGPTGNVIGGSTPGERNIISGNASTGVGIGDQATGNTVSGNYIGVGADGLTAIPNMNLGVIVDRASNHVIGGTTPGERNVISGNLYLGTGPGYHRQVAIIHTGYVGFATDGNRVIGNYIGTDATGNVAVSMPPSGDAGAIDISGVSPDMVTNTQIGGTAPGEGNVISGTTSYGIAIGAGVSGVTVQGNIIGLNQAGTAALGNAGSGVTIRSGGASNVLIGGTTAAARNIISGNVGDGVDITGSGTTGTVVEGNYIGTDITGTQAIGNRNGVVLSFGASGNTIGGNVAGAGNLISGNASDGIVITDAGTNSNVVEGNYVGTDATGSIALGNLGNGVAVEMGASNNSIGGTATILQSNFSVPLTAGAGNVLDVGALTGGQRLAITASGRGGLTTGDLWDVFPDGSLAAPPLSTDGLDRSYLNPGAAYPTVLGGDGINHFPWRWCQLRYAQQNRRLRRQTDH